MKANRNLGNWECEVAYDYIRNEPEP